MTGAEKAMALPPHPEPPTLGVLSPAERRVLRRSAAVVTAWAGVVAVLSVTGGLTRIPLLALPVLIVAGIAVPLVAVSRSAALRRVVRDVDLAHLTWFNTWRVAAAVAFFAVGAQGLLPARFVVNAAWGDLVAGLLAPVVVLVAARLAARTRVRAYLAFHVFSFGDLVVAVGTGLTFTPARGSADADPARHPDGVDPVVGGSHHRDDQRAGAAPTRDAARLSADRGHRCAGGPQPWS